VNRVDEGSFERIGTLRKPLKDKERLIAIAVLKTMVLPAAQKEDGA